MSFLKRFINKGNEWDRPIIPIAGIRNNVRQKPIPLTKKEILKPAA